MRIFCNHSSYVLNHVVAAGWFPGARYTNLRDIKKFKFKGLGFLDIDFKNYNFDQHLEAAKSVSPHITVARDIESVGELDEILEEAEKLSSHAENVVLVPKDPALNDRLDELLPSEYILGYSVPTKYGATPLAPDQFRRPVHLLGGRPDVQRHLAKTMPVYSIDCNRFTLDARFGKFFDGKAFRRHPIGGYANCLIDSITNITQLWDGYDRAT